MLGEMQESLRTSNNQLRVIKKSNSKTSKNLGSTSRTIRRRVASSLTFNQDRVNSTWDQFRHGKRVVHSLTRNFRVKNLAGNAINCIVSQLKQVNLNKAKR